MTIKKDSSKSNLKVELKQGTLLIMLGDFNTNYKHSVEKTKTKETRWNLTFRQIFEINNTSLDAEFKKKVLSELESLRAEIYELKSKITEKDKEISILNSKLLQKKENNNKVAILKCNIDNPTNENCAKMITEHLDGKMSIKSEEIVSVTDYKPKKGPLIVEVNSIEKKAALIRNSETTQNYVLKTVSRG